MQITSNLELSERSTSALVTMEIEVVTFDMVSKNGSLRNSTRTEVRIVLTVGNNA